MEVEISLLHLSLTQFTPASMEIYIFLLHWSLIQFTLASMEVARKMSLR